jgi:3-hydroxyisobutyrate dehydrogenase-like beta-hydroxyacid dehydrogenase
MVRRLVAAGHQVRALGRTDEKRSVVSGLGAEAVDDVVAVCAGAAAVVLCVFTDEQVRHVCLADGLVAAMPAGSTVVLHTTGSPRTAEAIAECAAPRGVQVVDAPVSGGPHNAAAGALTVFVGGADDAVAAVRPLLSSYGNPILHVGPLGAGQKVKLVNNSLFRGTDRPARRRRRTGGPARGGRVRAADRPGARQRVQSRAGHCRSRGFSGVVHRDGRRIRGQGHRSGPADRR